MWRRPRGPKPFPPDWGWLWPEQQRARPPTRALDCVAAPARGNYAHHVRRACLWSSIAATRHAAKACALHDMDMDRIMRRQRAPSCALPRAHGARGHGRGVVRRTPRSKWRTAKRTSLASRARARSQAYVSSPARGCLRAGMTHSQCQHAAWRRRSCRLRVRKLHSQQFTDHEFARQRR